MALAKHKLSVPAHPDDVRAFLDQNSKRFADDLQAVITIVSDRRKTDRRLASIYKIYSRGEHQHGDELKHPRKVRLKFNAYWGQEGRPNEGSLWQAPDIVGFTIVVPYPSDINSVNASIDQLVDDRLLDPGFGKRTKDTVVAAPNMADDEILTKYGRGFDGKDGSGYAGCHYNLRLPGVGQKPIVEIQIKPLLHDAWGAKTHDLTYKPAGRTDQNLLLSFDLLGRALANLDQQSDTLRRSIERRSRVRLRKRALVQLEILRMGLTSAAESVDIAEGRSAVQGLADEIEAVSSTTSADAVNAIRDRLWEVFNDHPQGRQVVCRLFCALAASTGRRDLFGSALEAIESWREESGPGLAGVWALATAALAGFGAGDASEAIDRAEEAVELLQTIDPSDLSEGDLQRYHLLGNSIYSSLAYYHADQIGSHEGDKRNSAVEAERALDLSLSHWNALGFPQARLRSSDDELRAVLTNDANGSRVFQSLDNEVFVRIQTAATEADAQWARARLAFLHQHKPAREGRVAECLFEYHDYCARARLAELEAAD